ncbi:uncharacterized protein METZ01_LOCUS428992, partial [marine metagenome]
VGRIKKFSKVQTTSCTGAKSPPRKEKVAYINFS